MTLVASLYNLPPRVLPSIHAVEGGQVPTIHLNADGSEDLGYMQINTVWLPALSRYTKQPPEFVRAQLLSRGCYNIAAAGLILRTYLDETGGDLMLAIGDYHSHTPLLNAAYQIQVKQAAAALFARPAAPDAHAVKNGPVERPPAQTSELRFRTISARQVQKQPNAR
jgi:hypothetical protein